MEPALNLPPVNPQSEPSLWLPHAECWGVAHTHARAEKVFHNWLLARGVPSFLPLTQRRRVYGRHIRKSATPLFSGYVFFDLAAVPRDQIFSSKKVAQVLEPPDPQALQTELTFLAKALSSEDPLRPSSFKSGMPARVKRGPLAGLEGELVRTVAGNLLILRVSFLGSVSELKIDEAFVEPLL